MGNEQSEKLDEMTNDLDELKTTVEELKENPPAGVSPDKAKALEHTIDQARDIADDMEDGSVE